MKITDHDLPKFRPGENVIINGNIALTDPTQFINNVTNQAAIILNMDGMGPIYYYSVKFIGGPYDGRIDKRLHEAYISK